MKKIQVLRPYQEEAVTSIFREWEDKQSTLLVLPTGTGKTTVFTEVVKRASPKRAMILVHRGELLFQAKERLNQFGISVDMEMAGYRAREDAWDRSTAIVSTIQTQIAGKDGDGRMLNFKPRDFGIVICDEAHHCTAESWRKVIEYYKLNPDIKVLGVTATPDRADEEALGQVFDSVAYDYEIMDAIHDGWLVPIRQQMVHIENLDFSAMRTTAGDLNGADLAAVMEAEQNLHGIVSATIDIVKDRRTLVFAVSVRQAEMYADIFNRHRAGMASWVCGKTPKDEREAKLAMFKDGRVQVMVNVGVLTEGFDAPGVEVIAQARPTKSRSLYSQMIGRGTRPLPGLVDAFETAEERRAAITNSAKPSMLVIDFCGNSGRHKLITTADILGGKYSDQEIELAEAMVRGSGADADMSEELETARRAIATKKEEEEKAAEERKALELSRKAKLVAKAQYVCRDVSPFDVFGVTPERERGWDSGKKLSEKQSALLLKQGIDPDKLSYHQGKQMVLELFKRWDKKLATFKQCKALQKFGYETKEMTMKNASEILDSLSKNGWNRVRADESRAQRFTQNEEVTF